MGRGQAREHEPHPPGPGLHEPHDEDDRPAPGEAPVLRANTESALRTFLDRQPGQAGRARHDRASVSNLRPHFPQRYS